MATRRSRHAAEVPAVDGSPLPHGTHPKNEQISYDHNGKSQPTDTGRRRPRSTPTNQPPYRPSPRTQTPPPPPSPPLDPHTCDPPRPLAGRKARALVHGASPSARLSSPFCSSRPRMLNSSSVTDSRIDASSVSIALIFPCTRATQVHPAHPPDARNMHTHVRNAGTVRAAGGQGKRQKKIARRHTHAHTPKEKISGAIESA